MVKKLAILSKQDGVYFPLFFQGSQASEFLFSAVKLSPSLRKAQTQLHAACESELQMTGRDCCACQRASSAICGVYESLFPIRYCLCKISLRYCLCKISLGPSGVEMLQSLVMMRSQRSAWCQQHRKKTVTIALKYLSTSPRNIDITVRSCCLSDVCSLLSQNLSCSASCERVSTILVSPPFKPSSSTPLLSSTPL